MNRFSLILITILALVLGACNLNVDVDPTAGNVDISGTVPTDAGVTLTETLAITDTTGVTTTPSMTETNMVTDTEALTGTADMTETVTTPTLEPTATVTNEVSSAGAAITTTQQVTDSGQITDTVTDTDTVTGTDTATGTATSDLMTDTVTSPVTIPMTMLPDTSDMTIAEVVQGLEEFNRLESAIEAAGVGDALTVEGPITIFAPANGAFDAIPADQLQALLDDPALLAEILQYHIVIDDADSAELARLNAAQSTSGQPLLIGVGLDGGVLVNDAQIVFADIQTANGIIHVINQVLIPPTLDLEVPAADPESIAIAREPADDTLEELSAADTSEQTIVEILNSISGLRTVATAIDAAGLTDVLEQAGPFTLFAPTDPAFAEVPDAQLSDLLNDSVALADVLQYHLVLDTVTSGDLAVLPTLLTASGETLTVTVEENGQIFINGAPVYQADIEASNGIIHVVGELITPLPE